jgi:hypothetical protein
MQQMIKTLAVTFVALFALGTLAPAPAAAEVCDDAYNDCLVNAVLTGGTVREIGNKALDCTYSYVHCLSHAIMRA